MEEEKKEINEEEPIIKKEDDKYLDLKRSNSKNKAIIVVLVFVIIILLFLLILYYFNNKDTNEGGNAGTPTATAVPSDVVLSNDEAIKIAQDMHKKAINFWGDFKSESCSKEVIKDMFCYYDSVDNFNKKFYEVYSRELELHDVFGESKYNSTDFINKVQCLSPDEYMVKDNKVYVFNGCTQGDGGYELKGNYRISKNEANEIVAKYTMHYESEFGENGDEDAEIILVKEDNNWKIKTVTLIGECGYTCKVGIK